MPADVAEGFADLVEYLHAEGVAVVAVQMPYWPELEAALAERDPEWVAQRDAGYAQLSEAAGVELLETNDFNDTAKDTWFRDPRHLSRLGAGAFTRWLWADPDFRKPIVKGLASAD